MTNGPRTVPLAVFDAPSAATVIVTPPIPRTNPIFTVWLVPAAKVGIVPSAWLPTMTNPPSRSMLHWTLVASAVPSFAISADTPKPPEMLFIVSAGAAAPAAKYMSLSPFRVSVHTTPAGWISAEFSSSKTVPSTLFICSASPQVAPPSSDWAR